MATKKGTKGKQEEEVLMSKKEKIGNEEETNVSTNPVIKDEELDEEL